MLIAFSRCTEMKELVLLPKSDESFLASLPPCRVCGAKASGLHYGINTCEGCKVIF